MSSSPDKKTTTTQPPSTLQSYVDSAIGGAQEILGSLTGSTADQSAGQSKQASASNEHQASEASAKAGPYTLSSTGAVAKDDPNRTQGSWNQTVGAAKESIGNLIGAQGLKQEGIRKFSSSPPPSKPRKRRANDPSRCATEQNKEGKAQEAQGQLSDLGAGIGDRVKGTVGGAAAALTGDSVKQEASRAQHDQGKSLQRGVELDLNKQAGA